MDRKRLRASALLLALLAPVALAGCMVQGETTYEDDDPCWMFCGDTTYEYSWNGFVWFPLLGLLLIALIVVVIVAAVNGSQPPRTQPAQPPAQQQVVVHTGRDEDDDRDD